MELLQTAIETVVMACQKVLTLWNDGPNLTKYKKKDGDTPMTVIDSESSVVINWMLKKYRPQDSVNDEERGDKEGNSGITWWVDPFDGTSNYLGGFKDSVVGLAAYEGSEPIVAVVGHPFKKEIYYAEKGRGSWMIDLEKAKDLNSIPFSSASVPLRVSGNYPSWKERFLLIDSLFNAKTYLPKISFLSALSNPANPFGAMNVRSFGSNILYGALVASGHAQVSLTDAVGGFWDIAPTVLLVKEAGGEVFGVDGEEPRPGCQVMLATSGGYKKELLKALRESYRGYQGFR